jgi:GNAT superfamily N-acetyltransferase
MHDPLQSELSELNALESWHRAATAAVPGFDWQIKRIGDAVCSLSPTEPSILFNRVLELGSTGEPELQQLNGIREFYAAAGIARFFLHVAPWRKSDITEERLAQAGYEKYRGWMKFERATGELPTVRSDLKVRRVGPDRASDFAAIAGAAFGLQASSQPVLAAIVEATGYQAFMSFDAFQAAGTGVVFIDHEVAVLDWGATHPDFRCRGGQAAVLAARIKVAQEAGCERIYTMTGEAVPGDPQHSYSNIQNAGFTEAYLRENWIPRC